MSRYEPLPTDEAPVHETPLDELVQATADAEASTWETDASAPASPHRTGAIGSHLLPFEVQEGVIEHQTPERARLTTFALQVLPSLLLAGLGTLGAGALLDEVQHWDLFENITEMFILCPALLGLKGNLEMTFASRLSTAAHMGRLEDPQLRYAMIKANLMLIQCQAIVVAIAAAMLSIVMGVVVHAEFSVHDSAVILTSAIVTASLASLLLGSLMAVIVVLSRQLSIDPDNVATPLAAALGDLVTLAILAGIGTFLLSLGSYTVVVALIFCIVFVGGLFPYALTAVRKRPEELRILGDRAGWLAIISAMVISSLSGLILERFVTRYEGIAVLSPVINGVGGNLAAVQASRISTALHSQIHDSHNRAGLLLFAMVLPVSYVFLGLIEVTHLGHTSITPLFMTGYSFAALTQVCILLLIVGRLVKFIWHKNMDPDQVAIPLMTALGDFLGTLCLVLCFTVLWRMGDRDADVGE